MKNLIRGFNVRQMLLASILFGVSAAGLAQRPNF